MGNTFNSDVNILGNLSVVQNISAGNITELQNILVSILANQINSNDYWQNALANMNVNISTMSDSNDPKSIKMPSRLLLDAKKYQNLLDPAPAIEEGSGRSSYSANTTDTVLSVGGRQREPGRIYVSGSSFMNGNSIQYINGINTPYHNWNEFGSTNPYYTFEYQWWDEEFARLNNRGINCSRVWLICDCTNQGLVFDNNGFCTGATELFWSHVDSLVEIATRHKIYLNPTLATFVCFDQHREGSDIWTIMLGSEERLQSFIDNFILPLCNRYKNNIYFWAIDLCNEPDWAIGLTGTSGPLSTTRGSTCTIEGNGSKLLTFSKRISDYIEGQVFAINGMNSGFITKRLNDYQCLMTNAYNGPSVVATPQCCASPFYYCEGWNAQPWQRYFAMVSSAVHRNTYVLVTVGCGYVANLSANYIGNLFNDEILQTFTKDNQSKLDFIKFHYYTWMEPWFRLYKTPSQHGLDSKPAILGEVCADWAANNVPGTMGWKLNTNFNPGDFVWIDDNGTRRKYKAIIGGRSGLVPPSGTGSSIIDNEITWKYQNKTWEPDTQYNVDSLVINTSGADDDGRIYVVKTAGVSSISISGDGPQGVGSNIQDGTVTWDYIRDTTIDMKDLFDWFKNNGYNGIMPWSSNNVDGCLGLYDVDNYGTGMYPSMWAANTEYGVDTIRVASNGNWYISTSQGTTSTSEPTGTGSGIADGTVLWNYIKNTSMPPWLNTGIAMKDFSDENYSTIFPSISGQTWSNTGSVMRQTKQRAWYTAGSNMYAYQTFKFGQSEEHLTQRVGLFDNDNGIFLELKDSNTMLDLVVRSSGNETYYPQEEWNLDTMSISGAMSGSNILDLNNMQTLVLDFNWIYNKNRFGFIIDGSINWAHEFSYNNTSNLDFPSNPNLPLRWEIIADDTISDEKYLSSYHGYVLTNSDKENTKTLSYSRGYSSQYFGSADQFNGTQEVMALRLSSNAISSIKPKKISVLNTSGTSDFPFNWRIVLNPSINSDSAWSKVTGSSCVETTLGRSIKFGTGITLAEGFARGDSLIDLPDISYLGVSADGISDVISFIIFNTSWYQSWIYTSLMWEEIS